MDELCAIAVDAIATALTTGRRRGPSLADLPPALVEPGATFVTLERDDRLLGCVGALDASQPLGIDVAEHALAAAFDDPRLPPLTRDDFPEMSVKVSVLTPSEPLAVHSYDELRDAIRPGTDGVTIEVLRGDRATARATFLPSVWEKVRDVDDFLDALWDKAGLERRSWPPGLHASRYTTVETVDPGPRAPLPSPHRMT